tara:strand:- start:16197 stop:17114 length:918 start_codon:yes stop_codon:yes gene_type:complete
MNKDEFTNQELMLDVGDGHKLYVQDWGNKSANVVIFYLHGGPGSGSKDKHKRLFDPTTHRVVFYDQRGCGKSTPYGSLRNNTSQDLVEDIVKIADKLGINRFVVHGTSWGSTLALLFAIAHPERVEQLVIGGVFTGSKNEIDWLDQGLMKTHFPDVWQKYLESTPKKYRDNPSKYHFKRVLEGDADIQKRAGYTYENLEGGVMLFDDRSSTEDYETYDHTGIRIEIHYLANHCFLPDRYVFNNVNKLTMPVHIVQGRYDMVCPPQAAYELYQKLPNAKLYWTLSNHKVEHEGENIFRAIFNGMVN